MLNLPNQSKYYIFYKKSEGQKHCISMYPKRSQAASDTADASLSLLLHEGMRWYADTEAPKKSHRIL